MKAYDYFKDRVSKLTKTVSKVAAAPSKMHHFLQSSPVTSSTLRKQNQNGEKLPLIKFI